MRGSIATAALIAALSAAGAAIAHDESRRSGEPAAGARGGGGLIERGFARLERAIARIEARLSGSGGSMMSGCEEVMGRGGMMGGGMMGGARPNQQWSRPDEAR